MHRLTDLIHKIRHYFSKSGVPLNYRLYGLVTLFFIPFGLLAQQPISTFLSAEQVTWLDSQSEITVGAMKDWPPINFSNEYGEPSGIGADFVALLNKRLGNKLRIVSGEWDPLYNSAKEGKIDALLDITPKPERLNWFNFTDPYLKIPHVIVARKNTPYLRGEADLVGKTIALESGFGNIQYFQQQYPEVVIRQYSNTRQALDAVARGEVDAYAGNRSVALYLIEKELITNLKVHGRLNRANSILTIGVNKDGDILLDILNAALKDIREDEMRRMQRRWVNDVEDYRQILLTTEEQSWLQQHGEITMAFDENYAPYSFRDQAGEFKGIAVDIAKELTVRLGIKLNIFPTGNWNELYQAGLNRKLDVIATLVKRDEREKYFAFSSPYLSLTQYVITRKQNVSKYKRNDDLRRKVIALVKGYSTSKHVLESVVGIEPLYVENMKEALVAVSVGKADATIADIGMAHHVMALHNLPNLGFSYLYSKTVSKQRFGVRADWPTLAALFNKALHSLSYKEMLAFYQAYSVPYVQQGFVADLGRPIDLTESEKNWLKAHPKIRLASDYAWPPFESIDEKNNYRGIAADYMRLLETKLGVDFIISPRKPWDQITDMVRQRKLDVFSCAMETASRRQYAQFTKAYVSNPMVIVTRDDVGYLGGIEELNGKRVGMERGYASFELVAGNHPEIDIIAFEDSLSVMNALSQGEIEAYIGNIANLSYLTRLNGITNIKISGSTPYRFELALGIRKDWPELVTILQKALDSITEEERNAITRKWISIEVEESFDYQLVWKIVLVAVFVIFAFLIWNLSLNKKIRERTSQLQRVAHHDSLTGLPNRLHCLQLLDRLVADSKQDKKRFVVMFVDLDDFKSINDSMGHHVGDTLLQNVSIRLKASIYSGNIVGRLGGDEFIVIVNDAGKEEDISRIAEKILASFTDAFNIEGRHLKVSTSIGIAIYPDHGQNTSDILRNADTAMYHSKKNGRNVYSYYTEEMNLEVAKRLQYTEQLNDALVRNEIECYYQPKLSLPDRNVKGFEVLARWNSKQLGWVSPVDFIPIAESVGLIVPIGQFVFQQALNVLGELQAEFDREFTMAINISPVQFRDTALAEWICHEVELADVGFSNVELEITEGVLMNEYDHVVNALAQLTTRGIRISMDDFGTGYSSMSYLRKFPFNSLKIDREFICDMAENDEDKKLVQTTINLAQNLGMEVVAEGVETAQHVKMLSQMHCDTAQGYFFSKPLPYEELKKFLKSS